MAQPSTSGVNQETVAYNYSVDRVVSQAKQRVDGVAARGQESLAGFAKQFATGKEEVDHMLVRIIIFDIIIHSIVQSERQKESFFCRIAFKQHMMIEGSSIYYRQNSQYAAAVAGGAENLAKCKLSDNRSDRLYGTTRISNLRNRVEDKPLDGTASTT
uniref:Uncharacterized protein n=1 Tax=Parascaris univalens TaxID=6257 RepID=A0A915AL62_PARUN